MSYRFAAPSQVFYNLAGTTPIPGGGWSFYEPGGTTTPKLTYSDEDLTTANSQPVLLDSSARLDVPVWCDGPYFAELKDANDVVVWNGEITSGIPDTAVLTPLGLNQIWLGDGAGNAIPTDFLPLPDPTGSDDYMVVVSGDGYILQPQPEPPEIPEPEVVVTTSSVRIGTSDDETKWFEQGGTASTSTGVGTKTATGTVTFATPFATLLGVQVTPRGGPHAPGNGEGGYFAKVSVTADSTTGFTVTMSTNTGEDNADGDISGPISFFWKATGTVEIAP